MQAFQERVVVEKNELDEKINKLSSFIESDRWSSVAEDEKERMRKQLVAMGEYSNVLSQRIANF